MAETRVVQVADLNAKALALAPVIFQECIEKGNDIRVSIFGNDIFAVTVETQHAELIDWRLDPLASYHRYDPPRNLSTILRRLMDEMKLEMGSIDLRIDRDGEPVFFELNPNGQFLFMETDADLPVSEFSRNASFESISLGTRAAIATSTPPLRARISCSIRPAVK